MAVTTIRSTYSLDVESVRSLEALAQHWNVPKSEVLRRAIRMAAEQGRSGTSSPLAALNRLQAALRERKVDVKQWAQDLKVERRETARRGHPKSR